MDNRYEVVSIALSDLREHPANSTYKTPLAEDSEEYKLMAASIAADGLRNPLLVQYGTNTILSGHTRFRIVKSLGWTDVPVMLLNVSDDQAEDILVQDNLERASKEQDLIRLARSVERLMRKYASRKEAYQQISDVFNVQDRQLDRLRSLMRLNNELQELVSQGHIGLKAGASIAGLNADQQQEVIAYIANTGLAEPKDWKLTEKEASFITSKIRKRAEQEIDPEPEQEPEQEEDQNHTAAQASIMIPQRTMDTIEVPENTYEPETREEELSAKGEQTIFKALTLLKRDIRAIERITSQTAPTTSSALEGNSVEVKKELSKLKKAMREALNAL